MDSARCTSRTVSLRPTLASYTFALNCPDQTIVYNFPGVIPYYMNVEGITYARGPSVGPTSPGTHTFDFLVRSNIKNMTRIKFELYNNTAILASVTKNVGESNCTGAICYTSIDMNMTQASIKGRYFVDLGDGFITLESDANWKLINTTILYPNIKTGFQDLTRVFDSVYDNSTIDANRRAEYSRFVFLFLLMAILLAFFNKVTGYDMANPGAFLIIMTLVFWIGSMAGGLPQCDTTDPIIPPPDGTGTEQQYVCTGNGFFYYQDLVPENSLRFSVADGKYHPDKIFSFSAHFINNYILAILVSLMGATYWFSIRRRMT
jgi:hypothetical protein